MQLNRRQFLITTSATSALLLTGCQTIAPDPRKQISTIHDTITSFLITENKDTLVVIGNKFHYIFNSKNTKYISKIIELLSSPLREIYQVAITDTEIHQHRDKTAAANARLIIKIKDDVDLTPQQQEQIYSLKLNDTITMVLKGDVYRADQSVNDTLKATKTYHEYPLTIKHYSPAYVHITDILLTPVRVVGSNIAILGFMLIYLPIFIFFCHDGSCFK